MTQETQKVQEAPETPEQHVSLPGKALAMVLVLLLLLTAALVLASFPIGLYTMFFTTLSDQFNASSMVQGVLVFVGPFVTSIPLPGSLGGFFVGLSAVYAGMFVLAARQGKGVLSSLRGAFREGIAPLFANTFFVTLIAIGFLAFTILVIDSVESSGGVPIGGLSGDAMQLMMSLTIAPLREEFGFRMVIIGIVALFVSLGKPWRTFLKALWRPSAALEGEENTTLTKVALVLASVVSSVAFGLVHVQSGAGWQIGKLPEAAFAGLVLSYLYIWYGFHVAVLTHWGIDYLASVFAFFGQGAYGIPWTADNAYILQQVVALDIVAFFGVACFLAVCYLGLKMWSGRRLASSGL